MTDKQKQNLLAFMGFYNGTVDGIWGAQSQNATRRFQEAFGLEADGDFGRETEERIRQAVGNYDDLVLDTGCEDVTDINVGDNSAKDTNVPGKTGTFWDEIEFFTRDEFKCKCGGRYCNGFYHEPKETMVRLADGARRHFGKPAIVISGLRCPQHNANEGGVDNSQHIYGEACDIQIPGVSANTLLAWFQSQAGVRYAYAINSTNVHFDIPKGER